MRRIYAALIYNWGGSEKVIGRTGNRIAIRKVAQGILNDAQRTSEVSRKIDPILQFIEREDFRKLQRVIRRIVRIREARASRSGTRDKPKPSEEQVIDNAQASASLDRSHDNLM